MAHTLSLLDGAFAILRLPPEHARVGVVAATCLADPASPLVSISRTRDELSVVVPEALVEALELGGDPTARCERGWRAFRVDGPLPFDAVGILASLTAPLASAGISIFSLSTYDTDYVLVKSDSLAEAHAALAEAGHVWRGE